jgi:RNA polymerase sigma-70 factor (ECF subfamily)
MDDETTVLSEEFIPTRYSLLSRLQDREDNDSWKEFFDTYWRLIYSVARKSGLNEMEAQEVVQETVISVARDIEKFKRDRRLGSFKGWLRNLTRWRIADQLRKRTSLVDSIQTAAESNGETPEQTSEMPDEIMEARWEEEWQSNLLQAAMERVKKRVREEHYQMFELQMVREWPASKVAETLGVSAARVYLAKHRVSALIKKEARALQQQWERHDRKITS